MSLYLSGTFETKEAVIAAIKKLKSDGFTPDDLAAFSDEPLELPRGVLERPSNMSLAVVCFAALTLLAVIGFVYFTQYNYKLATGGMPIFSGWPVAVVFYEVTMAGAILSTTIWFIWESGLLRRDKSIPVPSVDPEKIYLRVRCTPEAEAKISETLKNAGGLNVGKLERKA